MAGLFFGHPALRHVLKHSHTDYLLCAFARLNNNASRTTRSIAHHQELHDAQSNKSGDKATSSQADVHRQNLDKADVERHQKLIATWWDLQGPMKGLHAMNDLRIKLIVNGFINSGILKEKETITNPFCLNGFKICDVGCGGGILSEALARLGADVTGIDPGPEIVELAKYHASANESSLPHKPAYIASTIEAHATKSQNVYDGLIASEVIEHVPNKQEFVEACLKTVKPGGSIFFTTPNRTYLSWLGTIFIAENVLKIVPKGIHSWDMFITPSELKSILEKLGCRNVLVNGAMYNFVTNKWFFTSSTFHYTIHAIKNK